MHDKVERDRNDKDQPMVAADNGVVYEWDGSPCVLHHQVLDVLILSKQVQGQRLRTAVDLRNGSVGVGHTGNLEDEASVRS